MGPGYLDSQRLSLIIRNQLYNVFGKHGTWDNTSLSVRTSSGNSSGFTKVWNKYICNYDNKVAYYYWYIGILFNAVIPDLIISILWDFIVPANIYLMTSTLWLQVFIYELSNMWHIC